MKTFLILLLIFVCVTPVFAVPGFDPNNKARLYDVSDLQEYATQLRENFHKKYTVIVSPSESYSTAPMGAYYSEVEVPIFQYMIDHPEYKYIDD